MSKPKEPVILPSDPVAEQKLIAAVIDDAVNLPAVAGVNPECFYRSAHRTAWRAIMALHARREVVTYETLLNELQVTGKLADAGGEVDLMAMTAPGMNPGELTKAGAIGLARVVAEKYVARLCVKMAEKLAAAGYDMNIDVWQELGEIRREIDDAKALLDSGAFSQSSRKVTAQSARDLMAKEIAPARWAVPNLFAEGLDILAGKPKKGKSTLALQVCPAIAEERGKVLGQIEVAQGVALYLALEDNERRIQRRLEPMLRHDKDGAPIVPEHLYFRYEWPRLDAGGIEALDEWLKQHPNTRIICIDTYAKVRSHTASKIATLYESDYESVAPLQHWAIQNHVAVVLIVHLRKSAAAADDVIDEISGSTGLTGAADNLIVMRKAEGITSLHRQGRDFVDDDVWALKGNVDTFLWEIEGEICDVKRSAERQAILDTLAASVDGLTPAEIAAKIGKPQANTRKLLKKMMDSGDTALGYDRERRVYKRENGGNGGNAGQGGNVPSVTGIYHQGGGTHAVPDVAYAEAGSVPPVPGYAPDAQPVYYVPGPRAKDACRHCGAHRWGLIQGVDYCMACKRPWKEPA